MTDELADGDAQCPVCDAMSDFIYRCSECGKLFEDDGGSRDAGRSVLGGGR